MKLRIRILFFVSGALFCAFLFFITDLGQEILRGSTAGKTGFQKDDIYIGSGLAPWVWMLLPSIILILIALAMKRTDKQKLELRR
jgi:hypothetical protein